MKKTAKYPKVLDESHKRTVELYLQKIGEPLPDWNALNSEQEARMVRIYGEIQIRGQGNPEKAAQWKLGVRQHLEQHSKDREKVWDVKRKKAIAEIAAKNQDRWDSLHSEYSEAAQEIIDEYWSKFFPDKPQNVAPHNRYFIRNMLYNEDCGAVIPENERDDWIKCCLGIPNETYGVYPGKKQQSA